MLAARPGQHPAAVYEQERQEAWERTVPAWTCDCGHAFKVLPGGIPALPDDRFHRILDDGLLGELAWTIRGIGITTTMRPDRGRVFATTIKRLANPQPRLFVEE